MKLKYIFLSLLTLATLSGCDNEELIGPGGNNNNQGEGLPAVLMISANTGIEFETKASNSDQKNNGNNGNKPVDDNTNLDISQSPIDNGITTYVYVYNSDGNYLASSASNETFRKKGEAAFEVIQAVSGKNIQSNWNTADKVAKDILNKSPYDIIVGGPGMMEGETVNVVIISNPTEEIKAAAKKSLSSLQEDLTTLGEQVSLYKDITHSTASQYLQVTLKAGINYLGDQYSNYPSQGNTGSSDVQKREWFNKTLGVSVPLYRLISGVNLKSISNNTANGFFLRKVYLVQTNKKSKLDESLPESELERVSNSDISSVISTKALSSVSLSEVSYIAENSESDFSNWCQRLSSFSHNSGDVEYAFTERMEGKGIIITAGTSAPGVGNNCSVGNIEGTVQLKNIQYAETVQTLYALEPNNSDIGTYLILEGNYGVSANILSLRKMDYVRYYVPLTFEEDNTQYGFRRNHIYNVSVTIKGKGIVIDPEDPADPDKGDPTALSANIEIANMAEQDVDFEFGGDN